MPRARSWTDPFLNHIDLGDLSVGENLEALVGTESMPPALVLPLLHETTHHWCFRSSVGSVIAAIKARTRKRALSFANDPNRERLADDEDPLLLLDLVACTVATELLRPFGEGLAIAAELDSLTHNESTFVSVPFQAAARAFALPAVRQLTARQSAVDFSSLNDILTTARTASPGIRRKLNVYADPIGAAGQGYLLGYLAVRWMMRQLASKDIRLEREIDLALSFLRAFFYEDPELVDILLERNTNFGSLASLITKRIDSRFFDLSEVTAEDVREYENHASTVANWPDPARDESWASCLHYDARIGVRALERIEELKAGLGYVPIDTDHADAQLAGTFLNNLDVELLMTRDLVDLGTCNVNIRVADGKCSVDLDGKVILRNVETSVDDVEGPATIDVCYSTSSRVSDRIVIIADPIRVIAVLPSLLTGRPRENNSRFRKLACHAPTFGDPSAPSTTWLI
jgi:hypothetical protein